MFKGMVDKGQTMDDLTRMMQQGIHAGIDMVREPDIRVFDSLLTTRLNDRHINSRHQLIQLKIMPRDIAVQKNRYTINNHHSRICAFDGGPRVRL